MSKMTTRNNTHSDKGSFNIYKYSDIYPMVEQSIDIINEHNFSHKTILDSTQCELRYTDNNFNSLDAKRITTSRFLPSTIKPQNRPAPLPYSNTTHYFLHHESKEFLWIANIVRNIISLNEYCSNLDQSGM